MFERFENVFDALVDTSDDAANLSLRADLMGGIERIIDRNGWSRTEAAARSGVAVPRIDALLQGHIDKFTLDQLVAIAARLGQRIRIELSDRKDVA